ncbi:MAG TPA: DNA repair protein RadA [bacterium]|nr:DNA repair protein RadA [bacterium]HEX68623.1 DNA repair protein RadA [bacterium]
MSYICKNCGYISPKWMGRCPHCQEWNTFEEEISSEEKISFSFPPISLPEIKKETFKRKPTGINEFDRVLGGGLVPSSTILLGGEPGIGKSTLLLQLAQSLGEKTLYVSGEESPSQIKLRAERLGVDSKNIFIMSENNLQAILKYFRELDPSILILDSIQAVFLPEISSTVGSVSQVKECASLLVREAKARGKTLFIIGQVTKEGIIAGPKILEHMVDVVLYLEGEKRGFYRILRGVKNRFGPANEAGIFQMTSRGLEEVRNPSAIFLSGEKEIPGTAIVPVEEGTRIILVEIQTLLTATPSFPPRRHITGLDPSRALLLLAVLEKRVGVPLHRYDIFVNVVGGFRLQETAADLSFCIAILSAWKNIPLGSAVGIGEVGLGGEVRKVPRLEKRIEEGIRLGYKKFFVPYNGMKNFKEIEIIKVRKVGEILNFLKEKR